MTRPLRFTILSGCFLLGLLHGPAAWKAARDARSGPAEHVLAPLQGKLPGVSVALAADVPASRTLEGTEGEQ